MRSSPLGFRGRQGFSHKKAHVRPRYESSFLQVSLFQLAAWIGGLGFALNGLEGTWDKRQSTELQTTNEREAHFWWFQLTTSSADCSWPEGLPSGSYGGGVYTRRPAVLLSHVTPTQADVEMIPSRNFQNIFPDAQNQVPELFP